MRYHNTCTYLQNSILLLKLYNFIYLYKSTATSLENHTTSASSKMAASDKMESTFVSLYAESSKRNQEWRWLNARVFDA